MASKIITPPPVLFWDWISISLSHHGVELWPKQVRAPKVAPNFSKNYFCRQANRLTFRLTSDAAECKIYEITGQTVNYSFHSITRNITRLLFLLVTCWFTRVFDEPGFLLIRRSLVRAQVEEPSKKASPCAVLFAFNATLCCAEREGSKR